MKSTAWSDYDLECMIASCQRCIQSGHRGLMMPADKLALALAELLRFRLKKSQDIEVLRGLAGDQPHG